MKRLLRAFVLTGATLSAGLIAGGATTLHAYAAGRNPYARLDALARVLTQIELNFVDPVEPDALVDDAIGGMVGALDPNSHYLEADAWSRLRAGDAEGLAGLGLELGQADPRRGGALPVTRVMPDGPAARGGVQEGDALLNVDGTAVAGWAPADVLTLVSGPAGSPVRLEVERAGARLTLSPVRDRVIAPAVEAALFAPGWGYARVLHFRHRVSSELIRALDRLDAEGREPLRGLVLDLRDNPGGVLEEAVQICDLFVNDGLIVETRGRVPTENRSYRATPSPADRNIPVVILVNQGSASASEIVSGALRDLGRAKLVGETTYGKGSVQSVYEIGDGSALKLTVARYYLANGETIADRHGLVPDEAVSLGSDDGPEARLRAGLQGAALDPGLKEQLLQDLSALASAAPTVEASAVPWSGTLNERLDQDRQLASAFRLLRGAR